MKLRRLLPAFLLLALLASAAYVPVAQGASSPAWSFAVFPEPGNLTPGITRTVLATATNIGSTATSGITTIELTFPPSLTPSLTGETTSHCAVVAQVATCTTTEPVGAGEDFNAIIRFHVAASPSAPLTISARVTGGGAAEATAEATPALQASPLPFQILPPGLRAPLTEEDGTPSLAAGSHPYQQTTSFEFPTYNPPSEDPEGELSNSGHPHDIEVRLPPGLVGDPAASPVLCTEAQLESKTETCPAASAVGVLEVTTILESPGVPAIATSPLYDMVPPPGAPAELASEIASVGLFAHLIAGVRSDADYGIEVTTPDTLALGIQPIFGIQAQIWGDPSAAAHDDTRGHCANRGASSTETCPVEPQKTAFWTTPTECSGAPTITSLRVDTWEQPGQFAESSYQSADLGGSPVSVDGCSALEFKPTITARPTTDLADSPSGLDVDLELPQDTEKERRASAALRKATVTLPEGMAVNPSQADGLAACTPSQIGYLAGDEEAGIHFSKQPQTCPDASKLGSVEVTTPLLVERDAEQRIVTDPETGDPVLRPLHGSLYLAQPFHNPFGSLLAIYLVVEDPTTGTVAKLAGKVETDPRTGRLTTVFEENPQLPIEDIHLSLFKGARAPLITPSVCGTHTTTTVLEPYSAPATPDAEPGDSFQTTAEPGGGSCPSTEAAEPNSPAFTAGTLNPQAGAYSPFVLKISREDGSQRLTSIDATLAPGLLGRLAGVGECANAQIARAESRSHPEEGILERESPSCPASSQVGTVTVGAGAGPTPFYTQGNVYLAGPYKGAPVSLAVITPAIAGPFDLGTVVDRVALFIEPETAQVRAVGDPLPTILDGIPLDVRSIALRMDRPDFTLNPTSCDPLAITGTLTSALGQAAPLKQRFQVGGCSSLPFKPKLSLSLKGPVRRTGHPRLIATLKAKEGEANVARAQVELPPAAFIDQAHIRTVCTRVQWAANACPAGSVYGAVEATTPLVSYPLTGSVYLRSSQHKLPDLVAKLQGPASQPIEVDLDGKTDSVKGALRNTFEAVPDAPVSTFRLELFGGKRGLVEMSNGFCQDRKATVDLVGQNGKAWDTSPVVGGTCPKGGKGHPKSHRHGGRGGKK